MRVGMPRSAALLAGLMAAGAMTTPVLAAGAAHGWYARGEIGGAFLAEDNGYWTGPGKGAPRITFGLNNPSALTGGLALGYDWMDGIRTDLSFTLTGNMDVTADIKSASDGSDPANHVQQITGAVHSQAVMANLFVEPMKAMGHDGPIQPFLTGGIGVAHVSMGEWTRYNPSETRVYRTFEGDGQTNFAWSVGGGLSFDLGKIAGGNPAYLDLSYRYSDLGNVSGSATPLPGNGNGEPREPFNFDYTTHTITVGLRVPFAAN